jgi:soluble P-type ATPase
MLAPTFSSLYARAQSEEQNMDDGKILLVIAAAVQKASIDDPAPVPGIPREQLVLTSEESDLKAMRVLRALRANRLKVVEDLAEGQEDVR